MQFIPGVGAQGAKFGIKEDELVRAFGKPDRRIEDGMGVMLIYNDKYARFRFDKDLGGKLTTIECSDPSLTIMDRKVIGMKKSAFEALAREKGFAPVEYEDYDSFETAFCDPFSAWFTLEYGRVSAVKCGPLIGENDEVRWP